MHRILAGPSPWPVHAAGHVTKSAGRGSRGAPPSARHCPPQPFREGRRERLREVQPARHVRHVSRPGVMPRLEKRHGLRDDAVQARLLVLLARGVGGEHAHEALHLVHLLALHSRRFCRTRELQRTRTAQVATHGEAGGRRT